MILKENDFKKAVAIFFPVHILHEKKSYRLEASMTMCGGYRIMYCNQESVFLDEMHSDPLECIKFFDHSFYKHILSCREISGEDYAILNDTHDTRRDVG
jgi:hypothetical protein